MNWELPLLLGFFLLLSTWNSSPLTDHYFFIDSYGIKHHILTPYVSNHNAATNLTNFLFTRYENPWMEYTEVNIIFVAVVFNPVAPLYLDQSVWRIVDIVAGGIFAVAIFI